jgi:peptidoglycan/xylan/chitin deacetylase (PgdA/CDA1 family)
MVRDFVGYGRNVPKIKWPDNARLALSIAVNYEEGAERSIEDGDALPEGIGEMQKGIKAPVRDLTIESIFEYGSRVGFWRLIDLLEKYDMKATYLACALALERNPQAAREIVAKGHEICSHGYRWSEHTFMDKEEERESIRRAVLSFQRVTGERPSGWYCRYGPSVFTRELLAEEGFTYDSDSCADDTPYMVKVKEKDWVIVPYTMDVNDFHFYYNRFHLGDDYFQYAKDTFDWLYQEAGSTTRMMTVALHNRVIGRPGRIGGLEKFLQYVRTFPDVWIAKRVEIADWWYEQYPKTR